MNLEDWDKRVAINPKKNTHEYIFGDICEAGNEHDQPARCSLIPTSLQLTTPTTT